MENFKHGALFMVTMLLMAVADISANTSTVLMWYEPECPQELLK